MKILVTGGAGFIGGNFAHLMVNQYPEDEIVVLDALTYAGNLETLAPVMDKPNFRFVKGDITDREFIDQLFEKEKFDIVVNFAAESHVDRSIEDPGIFLRTNILGVQTLMDACRKYGIKRYHQVCRWTGRTCCSAKIRRSIPVRHTVPPRHRQICLYWHITAPSDFRSRSADAPITTDRITFLRN